MTRVQVNPGACGFICLIEVGRTGKYKAATMLESQCGQVAKLAAEVREVDFLDIMKAAFGMNRVFQCAAECKLHQSCPVPTALIKAVEAEVGLAVKKNVTIGFTGDGVENSGCKETVYGKTDAH